MLKRKDKRKQSKLHQRYCARLQRALNMVIRFYRTLLQRKKSDPLITINHDVIVKPPQTLVANERNNEYYKDRDCKSSLAWFLILQNQTLSRDP